MWIFWVLAVGAVWVLSACYSLFSSIASSATGTDRIVALVLFVIAALLSIRNKYAIAYLWFAATSALFLIFGVISKLI